jgi:hypothetical protein
MHKASAGTYVHVTGPESGGICDHSGDEYAVWTVAICGPEDEVKAYTYRSYREAARMGAQISRDREIELVMDADEVA